MRAKHKRHLEDVEAWLRAIEPEIPVEVAVRYQGPTSKLIFLGLKVPTYTAIHKANLAINGLAEAEAEIAWEAVWTHSSVFEARSAALAWFLHRSRYARALDFWPRCSAWAHGVDNWPHSDSLSKLLARCLELAPKTVFPHLKEWNLSEEPWLQRLSLTSLLYYASAREAVLPFAKLIPLVERHLTSDDHYVVKAVGWTLRELHNVYPKETYAFLAANISCLKPYAFSASTEKMTQDGKAKLKRLREKERSAPPRATPSRTPRAEN